MTTEKTYLPLGSIVTLKGAMQKLMIVRRAIVLNNQYFDYGAVSYPEGMFDENVAYFEEDEITNVIYQGFSDDDDKILMTQVVAAYKNYEQNPEDFVSVEQPEAEEPIAPNDPNDLFASVRDLED
jgi:hypothetical protein